MHGKTIQWTNKKVEIVIIPKTTQSQAFYIGNHEN